MRLLLASGCVAVTLLSAAPSYAQLDVGSGLVGAGVGAAIGGIAGGGRGAATGAIVGGSVGAVTGAFSPLPSYAYPYHGHVAHGGCHWIPAHYDAGHKVEHVRFVADSLQWRDVDSNSRSLVETSRQIAPLAFWGVVAR